MDTHEHLLREILGAAEGMKEVYRNVFTVTPKTKMKQVTLMLKAIHAQESKEAAQEKAASIALQPSSAK